MHTDGTILGVDRAEKSFTTQSGFGSSIFKTTNHTMFRTGAASTNWGAVKTGSKVGTPITSKAGARSLMKL
jgi:hypothetical protein